MTNPAELGRFLATQGRCVLAELSRVRGSSPREAGAHMVIAAQATLGTIGGGALEHLVIDRARRALQEHVESDVLEIPLGPEIGQCCGGHVEVTLTRIDAGVAKRLVARAELSDRARPHVYLFGAGHVGKALSRALVLLPLHVHVVDTRPDELDGLPEGVDARAVALPEAVVRSAPAGSAFVILTHDHALDFLICSEALQREDARYVGMVGSRTKRARFASWFISQGGDRRALERLVLPIGSGSYPPRSGDKRPEVIAALAAAEIMVQIGQRETDTLSAGILGKTGLGAGNGR